MVGITVALRPYKVLRTVGAALVAADEVAEFAVTTMLLAVL